MKQRASTDLNVVNIPTYFNFKTEFFRGENGGHYTITVQDFSYKFNFQDEKFKKFMESGNMYNVIEMILSQFLGSDLSHFNLKGPQFLSNMEHGSERITKCENIEDIVPETFHKLWTFVIGSSQRIFSQKLAHRMISKICSRHSERLRRMEKKAALKQNH